MLELGQYQMDTWYFSPLPKEMFRDGGLIDVLYVDEFSLNFFTRKSELLRFQAKELPKNRRHPPGNEIYRCGNLSMFEVDGFEERQYCQNLCYIAKLFLDHKTLYFDVDPFLFYVLCEVDERGYHPVGYYSKEKYSDVGYNLGKEGLKVLQECLLSLQRITPNTVFPLQHVFLPFHRINAKDMGDSSLHSPTNSVRRKKRLDLLKSQCQISGNKPTYRIGHQQSLISY